MPDSQMGAVAQRLDYDEFGVIQGDTAPGFQPFGFAGGLYDPDSGLVHFGARDYDPQAGRWLSKDPLDFGGGDSNLYVYAYNDPVNQVDRTGAGACRALNAEDRAAILAKKYLYKSDNPNETAGRICEVSPGVCVPVENPENKKYATPTRSFPGPLTLCKDGNPKDTWHTHSQKRKGKRARLGDENFSPIEIEDSDSSGTPDYMLTPSGKILKYTPPAGGGEGTFEMLNAEGTQFCEYTPPLR